MAKSIIGFDKLFYFAFQTIHPDFVFFGDDWPVDTNGDFNRGHLNWDFNPSFNLDGPIDINRFVNIDWLFDDGGNFHCLDNLSRWFIAWLNCHFFLHLDVLGDLNYLLNNSFRAWHISRDFHNNFHRFFYHNLFDYLFGDMTGQLLNLILLLFQQPSCHI